MLWCNSLSRWCCCCWGAGRASAASVTRRPRSEGRSSSTSRAIATENRPTIALQPVLPILVLLALPRGSPERAAFRGRICISARLAPAGSATDSRHGGPQALCGCKAEMRFVLQRRSDARKRADCVSPQCGLPASSSATSNGAWPCSSGLLGTAGERPCLILSQPGSDWALR